MPVVYIIVFKTICVSDVKIQIQFPPWVVANPFYYSLSSIISDKIRI